LKITFKSPQPPFTKGGRGGIFPAKAGFAGVEPVMKNYLEMKIYGDEAGGKEKEKTRGKTEGLSSKKAADTTSEEG
jgi:hypothetical protein